MQGSVPIFSNITESKTKKKNITRKTAIKDEFEIYK